MIISVALVLIIGVSVLWWYLSTNTIRRYKAQSYEMKLISERQELDLKIYHQGVELQRIAQQIRSGQKVATPIAPNPPMSMPFMPAFVPPSAAPKDVP